ncbi:Pls/PosA family non-ribosomal peptide synthetase [Corynebacterium sp. J010B-136]|uniref:Pls/PosA family non-ribosomal peptide synthetase n=1 Tax=Corynebacterium sp. J010B-136 TaxID=2099401 RepID=UPI001E2D6319|nr:Pls/PosA family non-ribosomal peptide synthetase [Corynebacterium sp. J010B-136]
MTDYLTTLKSSADSRTQTAPIPRLAGVFQFVFVCLLYMINAIRYVLGALIAVWGLGTLFDAGWVPHIPGWPLLFGWLLFYSLPGKTLIAATGARILTVGMRPGLYRRGSWTHLRMWAAGRLLTFMQIDNLYGSPMAPTIHRMFGNKVARGAQIAAEPCVTGLANIGELAVVEQEVDLQGYWIDGDTVCIGAITIEDRARIGMRSFINPNAHIGRTSEILAGSTVSGTIPAGETWGGSPIEFHGVAGDSWPAGTPEEIGHDRLSPLEKPLNKFNQYILYNLGGLVVRFLQVVSMIPGFVLVYPTVANIQFYEEVFPRLLLWVPVFTILMAATWLAGVAVVIRLLSVVIRPGFYSSHSAVAAAVWLTHIIMQRTLISAYPVYASGFTPTWLRLLGARIGHNVEISTVETIPHLTWIRDDSFLADHSCASTTRQSPHWIHIGTTVIGEHSFVGNSGIVGPDQDVPDDSLIAVLSTNPGNVDAGSSWLGQNPHQIPRLAVTGDTTATYKPTKKLRISRGIVESCRIIPQMLSNVLDLVAIWALTMIYMGMLFSGYGILESLAWAALLSWPLLLVSGTIASVLPIMAKWLLVGRFRVQDRPLFSSFVWRGELVDIFVESLAIPALVRMSLGSPVFNWWNRLMGARVGKNVWCETWWLPEYDLVTLEDGASVNRGTVVQTHLFQDRVMSMEPVLLQKSATLGPNSFTLPGSIIGERATVGPGSLVQRHEVVPADTCWQGNPAQYLPVEQANFPRDGIDMSSSTATDSRIEAPAQSPTHADTSNTQ